MIHGVNPRSAAWSMRRGPQPYLLGGSNSLSWNLLTFANASERYATRPDYSAMLGPFTSNVPAIISYGGKRFIQIEKETTTVNTESEVATTLFTNPSGLLAFGADGASDLSGRMVLDKFREDTSTGNHTAYFTAAQTDTHKYCISFQVKTAERTQVIYIHGSQPSLAVRFDLSTLAITPTTGSPDYAYIYPTSISGLYQVYVGYTATDSSSRSHHIRLSKEDSDSYEGVSGEGLYVGDFNIIDSTYAMSYIYVSGGAVTKSKDVAYFTSTNTPAWAYAGVKLRIYPEYANSRIVASKSIICYKDLVGEIITVSIDTSNRINVDGSVSGSIIQTAAHTWSRMQALDVTFVANNGSHPAIITSGFTTGNNTYEGAGAGIAINACDVYIGQDSSSANQLDGFISELEPA